VRVERRLLLGWKLIVLRAALEALAVAAPDWLAETFEVSGWGLSPRQGTADEAVIG
jgi:hypothetical protein